MDRTKLAVDLFDKLADLYQEKYMDLDLYDDTYDAFCKFMPEKAQVLELACGPGNITRYLLNKRPDLQILATDLSPRMLELAKINNPAADFQLLDSRNMLSLGKRYDGIVCGFCFPYLSKDEAVQLIADASKALNESGVLYLSTMEDDYSKSGMKSSSTGDQVYMYYHEGAYLIEALTDHGFEVVSVRRSDSPSQAGTIDVDLVILARKIG